MSLLAGYDIVIELSNELVRELVITNLRLSGAKAAPPFEFSVPFKAEPGNASAGAFHLNVNAIEVDLQTTRPTTIQIFFADASAETPIGTISSLDGCIEVPVYFPYILTKNNEAYISLDLSGIEPWRIAFTSESRQHAESQLHGTALSYSHFEASCQETLAEFIQKQGLLLIPTGLTIVSEQGEVSPLKFHELEAHGVGPAEKAQQALGLFGTLFIDHSYDGTASFKTRSAIPTGLQVTLSISSDVFRRLVFCDSVAEVLGCTIDDLPTACGGGNQNTYANSGCMLSSIEAALEDNYVAFCGAVKSKFGDVKFQSSIVLAISDGKVVSSVKSLDLFASGALCDEDGPGGEAETEELKPLIEAIVTAVRKKICDKLSDCVGSGLLEGKPEQVLIVKDQGITLACRSRLALNREREAADGICRRA
jgi:hypothetical protein